MLIHYLILRPEGIPVFSFTNRLADPHLLDQAPGPSDGSASDILLSGLLSSFLTFSRELGGQLQQIKMDVVDIYLAEHESLVGVAIAEPSKDQQEVELLSEMSQFVTKEFYNQYESQLENWNGDITQFNEFGRHFERLYEMDDNLEMVEICTTCINSCCEKMENMENIAEYTKILQPVS